MIANIEGREFWKAFVLSRNLPPEHPRACSTDDVECFFSVLCDNVGSNFTLKRVLYSWRRSCVEFAKRIDPNLPFYYFTSYYEGARPSAAYHHQSHQVCKGSAEGKCLQDKLQGALQFRPHDRNQLDRHFTTFQSIFPLHLPRIVI